MKIFKKSLILLPLLLATSLHANFKLSEISPTSSIHTTHTVLEKEPSPQVQAPQAPLPNFEDSSSEPQEFNYWQEFFRMMLILGLILGGVLLIAWLLKGYLNKRIKLVNQQNKIKVLERRNLSQKSMLFLIEVEGKQMLIADSAAGGVKFLMNCAEPEQQEDLSTNIEAVKTRDLASRFSFTQILQKKLTQKALRPFSNSKNLKTDYEFHEES